MVTMMCCLIFRAVGAVVYLLVPFRIWLWIVYLGAQFQLLLEKGTNTVGMSCLAAIFVIWSIQAR